MASIRELSQGARPVLLLATAAVLGIASFGVVRAATTQATALKVCADPDNLPFSNHAQQGFENALAKLVADQLGEQVSYVWLPEGPNVMAEALQAGRCDVVLGVPTQIGAIETTRPYYWSSYVFMTRADRGLDITSLKDDRLKRLKIGVEAMGSDVTATPPGQLLVQEGLRRQLVAFPLVTGAASADAPSRLAAAVASGQIDVATLWGPQGGYFARHAKMPLRVTPISDTEEFSTHKETFDLAVLQYDISMGVRSGDESRRAQLDEIIAENQPQIRRLLQSYGVPLIAPQATALETAATQAR